MYSTSFGIRAKAEGYASVAVGNFTEALKPFEVVFTPERVSIPSYFTKEIASEALEGIKSQRQKYSTLDAPPGFYLEADKALTKVEDLLKARFNL